MASKQHAHASSANGTKLSINSDTCAHTTRACSTSGVELANHVIYIQSATRIRCAYSHCYQYTLTEPCNNQATRINRKIAPSRHYHQLLSSFQIRVVERFPLPSSFGLCENPLPIKNLRTNSSHWQTYLLLP